MLRLRQALREFFPAALEAFDDLTAPDALELLGQGPGPAAAARLTRSQITAALRRARRRDVEAKAEQIQAALRAEQLTQPPAVVAAYAATVRRHGRGDRPRSTPRSRRCKGEVEAHFGQHPDAEIYLSQPGLGDDPRRPGASRVRRRPRPLRRAPSARKNYAGTARSPAPPARRRSCWPASSATTASPDALQWQAFCALTASPGARAYYDQLRARGAGPPRRPAPARQPTRRHPPRLPQAPHPLRRAHRLGPPPNPRSTNCCLTSNVMGCLTKAAATATADPRHLSSMHLDAGRAGRVRRWRWSARCSATTDWTTVSARGFPGRPSGLPS